MLQRSRQDNSVSNSCLYRKKNGSRSAVCTLPFSLPSHSPRGGVRVSSGGESAHTSPCDARKFKLTQMAIRCERGAFRLPMPDLQTPTIKGLTVHSAKVFADSLGKQRAHCMMHKRTMPANTERAHRPEAKASAPRNRKV